MRRPSRPSAVSIIGGIVAGLIVALAMNGVVRLVETLPVVEAAAPVTDTAPPCDPIAATGSIVISRCVDEETGTVLYVNNVGFMTIEE